MTRKRNDQSSTELGLWLRDQPEIDSKLGYRATNLDYIWSHSDSGTWCMIEEKRYMSTIAAWQEGVFRKLHNAALSDSRYRGFHFIQFENTSPADGKTFWTILFQGAFWKPEELTPKELLFRLRSVLA